MLFWVLLHSNKSKRFFFLLPFLQIFVWLLRLGKKYPIPFLEAHRFYFYHSSVLEKRFLLPNPMKLRLLFHMKEHIGKWTEVFFFPSVGQSQSTKLCFWRGPLQAPCLSYSFWWPSAGVPGRRSGKSINSPYVVSGIFRHVRWILGSKNWYKF